MIVKLFGGVWTIISIWSSTRMRSTSTNLFPQLAACVTSCGMLPSSTSSILSLVLAGASLSGIIYKVRCLFCWAFFAVFQGGRASFQRLGKSSLSLILRPRCWDAVVMVWAEMCKVLKEAGVTVKRSKWDFARDGTSFLVKVNISDVCLDKNKTRVICWMAKSSTVLKLKLYLGLLRLPWWRDLSLEETIQTTIWADVLWSWGLICKSAFFSLPVFSQ